MACGCCGAPGCTKTGCSCRGGKSHPCRRAAVRAPPRRRRGAAQPRGPVLQPQPVVVVPAPVAPPAAAAAVPAVPFAQAGPINAVPDVVQPDHQVLPFTSAAINTDYSTRLAPVNTPDRLQHELGRLVTLRSRLQSPSFVSLTEWSSRRSADRFAQLLPNYSGVSEKLTYDRSQTLWDAQWRPVQTNGANEVEVSVVGKYIRVLLEHQGADQTRVALFTVHLPHKRGRATAQRNLGAAVQRLLDNQATLSVDAIVVAGDFNAAPDDLEPLTEKLAANDLLTPQFTSAVHGLSGTCTSSRLLDNVFFSDAIQPQAPGRIFTNLGLFTHYPILAAGGIQL